jgi:hypothetical protein
VFDDYILINMYLASSNWYSDVRLLVATMTPSSNGHCDLGCPSLIRVPAAMSIVTSSRRCYMDSQQPHAANVTVAMGG